MPNIFALPALNYWQMAGLVILARILFGGTGHLGQRGHGGDGRLFHNGNPLREKWMNMSEDERKEFMRSRGGPHPFHDFFNEPANKNGKDVPDSEGGKRE
jgi:hypothetical protein